MAQYYQQNSLEVDGCESFGRIDHKSDRLIDRLYSSSSYNTDLYVDDITFAYFPDDFKSSVALERNEGKSIFTESGGYPFEEMMCKSRVAKAEDTCNMKKSVPSFPESESIAETRLELPEAEDIMKLLEHIRCPQCGSMKISKVESFDESFNEMNIRFCANCENHFGVDDSMDLDDLQKLVSEKKVLVKPNTICPCGNCDLEKLVLVEDKSTGLPSFQCQLCKRITAPKTVALQDDDEDWCIVERTDVEASREEIWATSGSEFNTQLPPLAEATQKSRFVCKNKNCNNDVYDIFEKIEDARGRVTSVKCLACDDVQQVDPAPKVELMCPICRNKDEKDFVMNYDSFGNVLSGVCALCNNFLDVPKHKECCNHWDGTYRAPMKRRVTSLGEVRVGDHVGFKKDYVINHHAIIVDVRPHENKIRVVHYTGGWKRQNGHYTSIREEDLDVDVCGQLFYVYDYGEYCLSPKDVVERARSRIGEQKYNLLKQNCEHFARWCKTGASRSGQVKAFCRRLVKVCAASVGPGIRDGVSMACRGVIEGLPTQLTGAGAGAGVAKAAMAGAILFDVFLNLIAEVALFVYCSCRAHNKYKAGQISKQQFYREVCQTGCECAAGFLGATGGGFLGQLAIPVPFLGGLIGCTLGTLIGRFLGAIAGKQISDRFIDKKIVSH